FVKALYLVIGRKDSIIAVKDTLIARSVEDTRRSQEYANTYRKNFERQLALTDAKAGMELIKSGFVSDVVDGQTYWMPASLPARHNRPTTAHLLPVYDEYLVAYKDRSAPLGGLDPAQIAKTGNGIFSPVIVIDGRVAGTWKRTLKKDSVLIEASLFTALTDAQQQALSDAKQRYQRFLGFE
ncbi:MAG: hypothetical protein EOP49_36885, partial [Sphingobacteriales bacterium]